MRKNLLIVALAVVSIGSIVTVVVRAAQHTVETDVRVVVQKHDDGRLSSAFSSERRRASGATASCRMAASCR